MQTKKWNSHRQTPTVHTHPHTHTQTNTQTDVPVHILQQSADSSDSDDGPLDATASKNTVINMIYRWMDRQFITNNGQQKKKSLKKIKLWNILYVFFNN